ncbi:hypothetical protein [Pseudonocardia parietis]|uniref:Uncharacterized protein n=1 Tax=Pseudonocardia parietis TaxID=570936 RepID=A0ABS4VTP7_9PSEU|nr:hypothetical protein [Pseudonocardia parietis]MBP2367103.1 hypothetical protein [Pseudonocardia parietis]
MRLVFTPGDDQGYAEARSRLLEQFHVWARRRRVEVDTALVAAALDYKYARDRRLGRWTRAHIADALGMWFPRKVTVLEPDDVAPAFHALIEFLDDHDWFDPQSSSDDALHRQVVDSTPALHDGLADERNYDLGKFWGVQLHRNGVDPADPGAVQRFLDRAGSGEADVDRAALAEIMRRDARRSARAEWNPELPPVPMPGAATLVEAAELSEGLDLLRRLTVWVRAGRRLTSDGRLGRVDALDLAAHLQLDHLYRETARTSDDLPEVSLLLRWARAARLVRVVRGRLLPVKTAGPLLNRPIELWRRVFESVGRLGDNLGGTDVFGAPSLFGMSMSEAFPMLWVGLYCAGGGPVPLEHFHRQVRDTVNDEAGCVVDDLAGDVEQRLWRRDVTALLDACELLGAIELSETLDADELDALSQVAHRDDPDPTVVMLTPMGLWAVHEYLLEQGMHVPSPGELADEDVEYLCVRMDGVRREVAEAELAAWTRARETGDAVRELDRFLRRCEVPAHRSLALHALGEAGAAGRAVAARHRLHVAEPVAVALEPGAAWSGPAPAPRDPTVAAPSSAPHPRTPARHNLEPAG